MIKSVSILRRFFYVFILSVDCQWWIQELNYRQNYRKELLNCIQLEFYYSGRFKVLGDINS